MAVNKEGDTIVFDEALVQKAGQIDDILGGFLDEQLLVFAREVDEKDQGIRFLRVFVSDQGTRLPVSKEQLESNLSEFTLPKLNIYLNFFLNRRILRPLDNEKYELSHDSLAYRIFETQVRGVEMPKLIEPEEDLSPLVGLEPYSTKHAMFFHGRGVEIRELFDKVVNELQFRTTLVIGPLGVGKTSLILAGLIPRLESFLPYYQYIRFSQNFIEDASMQSMLNNDPIKGAEPLILQLAFQVGKELPTAQERKLIIFDQFEEFYIWVQEVERLERFYKHVDELLRSRQNCDLIFVIRDEFFSMVQDFERVVPGILDEQVRIKHLDADTAMRVIEKIGHQHDMEFESVEVVEKIVANIMDDSGKVNLSYLQMYMEEIHRQTNE